MAVASFLQDKNNKDSKYNKRSMRYETKLRSES